MPTISPLLICVLALGQATTTQPTPAIFGPPGEADVASSMENLSALSMDALIARLPMAGDEWHWDNSTSTGVDDLASLEMARRLDAGTALTDAQWRAALIGTGAIRYRDTWPQDVPYAMSLTVPRWLGITQIRVRTDVPGWKVTKVGELLTGTCGTFAMMDRRDARAGRALGQLPPGKTKSVFTIEVERGRSWRHEDGDGSPKPGMLWKGTIDINLSAVASWEEAIPASTLTNANEAVKRAIGASFRQWGDAEQQVPYLVIDPDCAQYPALQTLGLDIRAELMDGDRVLAESWLIASNADTLNVTSSRTKGKVRFYGSANFAIEEAKPDTSHWTVRLTGENKHAWMLWHATSMWKGTLTIPWAELVKHEEERVPGGRGGEGSTPYYK